MKEKLVFRIICMLCFFNFHVSETSKYFGNSTNSKTNDEQLVGGGKVKLLLIPFPFDGKHNDNVNGEIKTVDLQRDARSNEDPAKIMYQGDNGIKYAMETNKDIYKILTVLANVGNSDTSANKGFVPNAAVDGKSGFNGFLMLGDEVFGKRNAAASDYSGNFEGYKKGGREKNRNIGLGEFRIGNGKEVNAGIHYAGNKENGNGFGGNNYLGLMELFQHGSQQGGNFGVFGNGKSFGESFHSKGIGKFSVENGKKGWFGLGFGGFGQEKDKEDEINNYNGGYSRLGSPIVNHYFNVRNENGGFGGGHYQDGLQYQSNENRGFRNQKMMHCERDIKAGIDETGKANFAGGYSRSNAGNSNGKDGFVDRGNGYGISSLSFDQTPILSHSVSYSSSGDGHGKFLMEIGGEIQDGGKSEFSDDDVTYHDKKAK